MKYRPNEQNLYEEAMRTVPGMLSAMERRTPDDGRYLLSQYMREGQRLQVELSASWSILFTAALHWVGHLSATLADAVDVDRQMIAQRMAEMAVEWQCNGALSE